MNRAYRKLDIAIIILNWNSWQDTLECLTSLIGSTYKNYKIILIENGSTDCSLEKIRLWAKGKILVTAGPLKSKPQTRYLNIVEYDLFEIINGKRLIDFLKNNKKESIILIKSNSNLGFAGGCNIGIKCAIKYNFNKILLLNNDTTIEPECLKILSEFLDQNKAYGVVTPKIGYYDNPEIIWNCGGRLTFTGSRRYYHLNKKDNKNLLSGYKQISFISGCALFAKSEIFKNYGLLTERFFFGEEDYEFSLRMRKNKINMASVLSAKIYHKVGISEKYVFGKDRLAKSFIFYLNRFIDLKFYYPLWYWKIWRIVSLWYIIPFLIIKYGISIKNIFKFVTFLMTYSDVQNHVSKSNFFQAKEIIK